MDLIALSEDGKQVCSGIAPVCGGKPEHVLAGLRGSTCVHTCGQFFFLHCEDIPVLAGLEGHLPFVVLC